MNLSMNPEVFSQIEAAAAVGAPEAFRAATAALEAEGDFHRLFDALVLAARHELGLPLLAMGPISELPAELQTRYEEAVVAAGRRVRDLLLAKGEVSAAFRYAQMIGETAPIRAALEATEPPADEHLDSWVEIAVGHGVHPKRGLEWIVDRYGICQGITTCEQLLSQGVKPPDRDDCIALLVRTLHAELSEQLRTAIAEKEASAPPTLPAMLTGRPWLFAEDAYFIDVSHLYAVVRFARLLPKREELFLALQLCDYGERLSPRLRYSEPAPFEDMFAASKAFFKTVAGMEVEKGIEYFRQKANAPTDGHDFTAAEVYVHLLVIAGRGAEAVRFAGVKLNDECYRPAFGPTVSELCQKFEKFDEMAEFAERRGDVLSYLAGVVQAKTKRH